jgi:uncharacterized protein (DUF1499 family)
MSGFADFENLERSPTPNDYLVAPDALTTAKVDRAAPVFDAPPAQLFEAVKALLEGDRSFRDIAANPSQGAIKTVAVTPILRFKDDVDIKVLPAGEGATLAVYSRSRVGRGDLGANRKRVEAMLEQLRRS